MEAPDYYTGRVTAASQSQKDYARRATAARSAPDEDSQEGYR